jgi:two-component system, chemotaxis family, chemotaxis protein CheY
MTPFNPPFLPLPTAKIGQGFAREIQVSHSIPHILLVEENPLLQELLSQMLGLAGYRVTVYGGTQEALIAWIDSQQARLSEDAPTCLLLDLSFLYTNATGFLHSIRTQWQQVTGVIPRIIVLATNRMVAVELAPQVRVILKPFHMRDLLALIRA